MSQTGNLVILLALLLAGVLAEDDLEPIFKALGGELEMGFCFGDYIAAYRITAEGRELLGESSNPASPPEAFEGRINIQDNVEGLLGLKITNLQFADSGIYIIECKSNDTIENYRKHYLYVCGEENSRQEISLTPGTGADLVCNVGAGKSSQTTVRWYRDLQNAFLFLDTNISLEPLHEDFKGLVQARDNGLTLHVSDALFKDSPRFFCLGMKGEQCLSFQTIGLPKEPDMKYIYRSVGEKVPLPCSVDHHRQNYWETPFGSVNSSKSISFKGKSGHQIFVSNDKGDYSLVINSLTLDHSGTYKCFSTILVEEYIVNVCPVHESTEISFSTQDKEVSITCRFTSEFASLLWFRKSHGEDILIMDTGDPSIPVPEDLKGRVTENNSSLVIANPKKEDSGTYWCVVLVMDSDDDAAVDVIDYEEYDDSTGDDNQEEEDEARTDQLLTDDEYMDMCLFRQVTNLRFQSGTTKIIKNDQNRTQDHLPEPTPEPKTNLTMYAVCGAIAGLLVLCSIGIVVGIKMRAKKTTKSTSRDLELSAEEKPLQSN